MVPGYKGEYKSIVRMMSPPAMPARPSIICLFVSFIRQRCVRHNSSSFCKYIRMMIYLLALTKVFLLFLIFWLFYDVFIFFHLLIHHLFDHKFLNITSRRKGKEKKIINTKHKSY